MLTADQQAQDILRSRIEAERAAWRSRRCTSWDAARAAATKRDKVRQQAWWDSLSGAEREARQQAWSTRFASLPLVEQDRIRNELAARSLAAGRHPEQRRRQWLRDTPSRVLEERSARRAAEFRHLPEPLQAAYVASWAAYRARWGVQQSLSPGRATSRTERQEDNESILTAK